MTFSPGHERICTPTPRQPNGAVGEPCDFAVRRSARRLHLLGSRASASRLPGSARPTDGGNRPAGGNARDFFAAELPCVTRGSGRDEQDGRSVDDRQLGRILFGAPRTSLGLLMQCIEGVLLWAIALAAIAVACLV